MKQKGSSDVKGSLWNHLDKKVLLWHREAPLFLRVYQLYCTNTLRQLVHRCNVTYSRSVARKETLGVHQKNWVCHIYCQINAQKKQACLLGINMLV